MIARWNVIDAYAEHPDQINLSPYAYVGNNPINKTDPDGNCPICLLALPEIVEGISIVGEALGLSSTVTVEATTVVTGAITIHSLANGGSLRAFPSTTAPQDATRVNKSVAVKPATVVQAGQTLPGSRSGKSFTRKGKQTVIEDNKAKNGGKTKCENCGIETSKAQQSQKGVTPPNDETNVDHVDPKANGGSGTPDNGQVLCRGCNIDKGAKVPETKTPPN